MIGKSTESYNKKKTNKLLSTRYKAHINFVALESKFGLFVTRPPNISWPERAPTRSPLYIQFAKRTAHKSRKAFVNQTFCLQIYNSRVSATLFRVLFWPLSRSSDDSRRASRVVRILLITLKVRALRYDGLAKNIIELHFVTEFRS